MKFFALLSFIAVASAHAVVTPVSLEDGFELSPKLEKAPSSDYEEKSGSNGKVFKKNTESQFNVTKGKESSDKLEVYQLKMEKINGKVEKSEQIVELDKEGKGEVKSILKCGGNKVVDGQVMKGGCQSYSEGFCKNLLEKENIEAKIVELGEPKALEFYKEIYKQNDVYEVKTAKLEKLREFNDSTRNEVGEEPKDKDIKEKVRPIYPPMNEIFVKKKIHDDILLCRKVGGTWIKPSHGHASSTGKPKSLNGSAGQ